MLKIPPRQDSTPAGISDTTGTFTGSTAEVSNTSPATSTSGGAVTSESSAQATQTGSTVSSTTSPTSSSTPQSTSVNASVQSQTPTASASSATNIPSVTDSSSVTSSSAAITSSSDSIQPTQSQSSSTSDASRTTSSNSTTSSSSSSSTGTSSSISDTTLSSISQTPSISSESSLTPASSSSGHTSTITSSFVTTVSGQPTTITTVFPTLNSPASIASTNGSHTGVIAGAAIAGGLVIILIVVGIFLVYRRRLRRQEAFASRSLPAPRSGPLADDDAADLAGGPSHQEIYSIPPLMRIRGAETGSLFHEGVWPPPGERSRLEDPIRSNIDLSSVIDSVMGGEGNPHARWSSADSGGSSTPLLGHASDRVPSQLKNHVESALGRPSETTPLNPSGHAHQGSLDSNPHSPTSSYVSLPPGAAAPATPSRWRSSRSTQTTGTLPPTEARPNFSGLGTLVVVNDTPDMEVPEPLVDLTPKQEEPSSEITPSYNMIRKDTDDSWKTPLQPTVAVQTPVTEAILSGSQSGSGSESVSEQK